MQDRQKMKDGDLALDWGMAENLAYATLIDENFAVRLSGQDCGRGTFFHRHATLHNTVNRDVHIPLRNIKDKQPEFLVVVLDQFISSGEAKWGRLSGLTMFLPHGYEGQGPEHSSARLERYLQLCAQHNMQVCYPSTPAQMFHMIRRQMLRPYRKPLIVMTPKSLLRHKLSTSSLEDLHSGGFQTVIPEIDKLTNKNVKRVVFCTGKVYFDLLEQRREDKIKDIAICRVEQLYPFPRDSVVKELKRYPNADEVVWCQEEPKNQGAWYQTLVKAALSPLDESDTRNVETIN